MAVSGISAYSAQMGLSELLVGRKNSSSENNTEMAGVIAPAAASGSSSVSNYILSNSEELKIIFDEIAKLSGGLVTFTAVREYQAELQRQFNRAVREDLLAMGVLEDTEFTLASDGKGGIAVLCGSAESGAAIEFYFEKNPEMVKAFNKLQTLSNLDKARKEQGYSPEDVKSRIQIEALARWWTSEGTDYSQYMYFNDSTSLQFLGVSNRV